MDKLLMLRLSVLGALCLLALFLRYGLLPFTQDPRLLLEAPHTYSILLRNLLKQGPSSNLPFYYLNVPTKDMVQSFNKSGGSYHGNDFRDISLQAWGFMDEKSARQILHRHILNDEHFRDIANMEKLILVVGFIKHMKKRMDNLNLNLIKNVFAPQNFDGLRFILSNVKGIYENMEKIQAMDAAIFLSEKELNKLKTLKPGLHRYKWYKQGKNKFLDLYDDRKSNITSWMRFLNNISPQGLYQRDDPAVNDVIRDLRSQKIINVTQLGSGTQIKLIMTFANGGKALVKPMRYPKSQPMLPNLDYYTDFERHHSEISAFNLDRVLEFNRCPPVVGRVINITKEIKGLAEKKISKTSFVSAAGNLCFYGVCADYCQPAHAICGKPDVLEGSFALFLPDVEVLERESWSHPWIRSYSKRTRAAWQDDDTFCRKVITKSPYNPKENRRLLDIMDIAIFDFLIGNLDRHHYETFDSFGDDSAPLHLDNGLGFGEAFVDHVDVLAPVYHCCLMRYSTLERLLKFQIGPEKLSDAMRKVGKEDLLAPVLSEEQLFALDRRVKIILSTVYDCIHRNGDSQRVVIDDGF